MFHLTYNTNLPFYLLRLCVLIQQVNICTLVGCIDVEVEATI